MSEWRRVGTEFEGMVYLTKIDDENGVRNEQMLKRKGGIWFHPDGSSYVYYTPTHYKKVQS